MDERELIELVNEGDQAAFGILFDRYSKRLFDISMRYLGNSSDAEEVVQDTFLKVWLNRGYVDGSRNFGPYLIAIAKNRIYDIIRHKFVERKHRMQASDSTPLFFSEEEKIIISDLTELMITSIGKLPKRQKEILLYRNKGYSNPEIAEKFGISVRTVETHFSKAIAALRTLMGVDKSIILLILFSQTLF